MTQPLALDNAPAGEAAGWRRNEDIIDALPYVDTLSDAEKVIVDKLIREEVRPPPISFHTSIVDVYIPLSDESHQRMYSKLDPAQCGRGGAMECSGLRNALSSDKTLVSCR